MKHPAVSVGQSALHGSIALTICYSSASTVGIQLLGGGVTCWVAAVSRGMGDEKSNEPMQKAGHTV